MQRPSRTNRHIVVLAIWFTAIMIYSGITGMARGAVQAPVPEPVSVSRLLPDDGDAAGLRRALAASIQTLDGDPVPIPACWRPLLSRQTLLATAKALERLLAEPLDFPSLRRRLATEFVFYRLPVPLLVTGYYEPELAGSLQPTDRFRYPLYRLPDDLVVGKRGVWRRQDRLLFSYWSRRQIEEARPLAGQELVWVDDPLAAFFLQIRGSGRIRLADGSVRRLQYAGTNGRPYTSIGRVLVEEGIFSLEEVNLPRIRAYLRHHPDRQADILGRNERYVFFRWRDETGDEGPLGSLGQPLVAGRSVAMDPAWYPAGAVGYLIARQPRFRQRGVRWVSLHRFVAIHDTGSAIRGPGRLDFFFGHGPYAERAAGSMRVAGEFYLLLQRPDTAPTDH